MPKGLHKDRAAELSARLAEYEHAVGILPGLVPAGRRETLIAQMISSLRRIEYIREIQVRPISVERCNPHSKLFDPLRAAAYLGRHGNTNEAVWMTFIGTHFGKHGIDGWRLAANVTGSFGNGPKWTAYHFSVNKAEFYATLVSNEPLLRDPKRSGRYSNHRQYQSKRPDLIFRTFDTFHNWLFFHGNFHNLLQQAHRDCGQEPTAVFDFLYRAMDPVSGFGRLGRFDFLTMLSKLGLAPIEAGSVYLVGATGPLKGARLLLYNNRSYPITALRAQPQVDALDDYLLVGKQVIEDSLCNWQKNPDYYEYFRG